MLPCLQAISLLEQMLEFLPSKRPTCEQALQHPFLSDGGVSPMGGTLREKSAAESGLMTSKAAKPLKFQFDHTKGLDAVAIRKMLLSEIKQWRVEEVRSRTVVMSCWRVCPWLMPRVCPSHIRTPVHLETASCHPS